ncbi:MAG: hypothetical protein H0W61_12535 [Bacteroidetes bacterium]|nr:hypothetical protein [Bacteroidota bacterium]
MTATPYISAALIFISIGSVGQDLEKLGKKDMMKVSGGINYSNIFYNAQGIPNRRQPYTYFLNGNISANIMGISLPYTFSFSNNQLSYTQPVNIQSLNPTYKWVKGYLGITAMNFSSYTLNNHLFSGAGVELTPKGFKCAVLYGRFKKALEYDFASGSDINMSYKRIGWGTMAQYEKNGQSIKITYFAAKDDASSLVFIPVESSIKPMENTALSVGAKTTVFKKLTFEAEYAISALTLNTRVSPDFQSAPKNKLPGIFTPNSTSAFYNAYKSSLGYRSKNYGISFNYERIDPGYKTLGAYYFNNDFENFTIAPSITLIKGRLNISANTGLQRNNLDNAKLNSTRRWVGALNMSYNINKSWNINSSFSNFTTFTRQKPQTDPFYKNTLDTFNVYQVSQSAMLSFIYSFGKSDFKQSVSVTGNYQISGQRQGAFSDPGAVGNTALIAAPATVRNGNCSYTILFQPSKTSVTIAFNINQSSMQEFDAVYIGPSLNFARAIYKNLVRLSLGSTYNKGYTNAIKTNDVFNHRCSITYAPKFQNEKVGKMGFSLNATYLQNLQTGQSTRSFNEFTGTVGLNYNF